MGRMGNGTNEAWDEWDMGPMGHIGPIQGKSFKMQDLSNTFIGLLCPIGPISHSSHSPSFLVAEAQLTAGGIDIVTLLLADCVGNLLLLKDFRESLLALYIGSFPC